MKPDIRWQLLLAVVCIGLVLSVIGFQLQSSGICTDLVPASGGRVTEGIVGRPSYINPLFSDANPIDQHLVDLVFDGLTRYDSEGNLIPALAESWNISDDGLLFTFQLREGLTWHDDTPVTSQDVAFTYNLLREGVLPSNEVSEILWESVSIRTPDDSTIEFKLEEPYGPFIEATTRGVVPAHILGDVDPKELAQDDFNRFPVGTGPFIVDRRSNWQVNGILRLTANPNYWRQGVTLDGIDLRFFADSEQLAEAYISGEIQAITALEIDDIGTLVSLPGLRVFTSGKNRLSQINFNLAESGSPAIQDVRVRRALASGLDREAIIDRAINGQGLPLEGPYIPSNWAYNAGALTSYSYDPEGTSTALDEAGWIQSEESKIRYKEDQPLAVRLLVSDDNYSRAVAEVIADQWGRIGARVTLVPVPSRELVDWLGEGDFDVALVDIEPTGDPDLYDFWSQEAIVRGQNYGSWNHRWASEALEEARKITSESERKQLYNSFLNFFNTDLPALTLYQHVNSYGINEVVEEVDIGRSDRPRDKYESFANWFFFYREVVVPCDVEEA